MLTGCSASSTEEFDVFQYRGSYAGDNSAVVNTVLHLQGADQFRGMELKTKEEPYGIIVNYDWSDSTLDAKETTIHNASYLFALIQNVDWVTFRFEGVIDTDQYTVTREQLQALYGIEWNEIKNANELKDLIESALTDDAEATI